MVPYNSTTYNHEKLVCPTKYIRCMEAESASKTIRIKYRVDQNHDNWRINQLKDKKADQHNQRHPDNTSTTTPETKNIKTPLKYS